MSNFDDSEFMDNNDGLFAEEFDSTLKDDLLCDDIKFPHDDDMIQHAHLLAQSVFVIPRAFRFTNLAVHRNSTILSYRF